MTFESTVNGNSIFLPFGGIAHDGYVEGKDNNGHYWANERDSTLEYGRIYKLDICINISETDRFCGLLIRPVLK